MKIEIWEAAGKELAAGRRVFVSLVATNEKGSPGTAAAGLLLDERGRQRGTVGGGIMEKRTLERGAQRLAAADPRPPTLIPLRHRAAGKGEASGLVCGGSQTNVEAVLGGPEDAAVLAEAIRKRAAGEPSAARFDACGLRLVSLKEPLAQASLFEADAQGRWRLLVSLANPQCVAIFGGGHCGAALARQMAWLGYATIVVEPRAGLFTLATLAETNARILPLPYAEGARRIDRPDRSRAVIMTHSLATDVEALAAVLKYPFRFVGLMGSDPKISRIREQLQALGFGEADLARIQAPVGLPFDSDTPEEIAVSVAAQILLERRTGGR